MRRSLALRIGTLLLVVFTTTAPAFAAPRDDQRSGPVERFFARVVSQIHRILKPLDELTIPK